MREAERSGLEDESLLKVADGVGIEKDVEEEVQEAIR